MEIALKVWTTTTLIIALSCLLTVYSAPVSNDVASEDLPLERVCIYQAKRYPHGSVIETTEPCLNCTCNGGVLVCFLRVCHKIIVPPNSGCKAVKFPGKCCTELVCGVEEDVHEKPTSPKPIIISSTTSIAVGLNASDEKSSPSSTTVPPPTTLKSLVIEDDYEQWSSTISPLLFTVDDNSLLSGCVRNGSVYAEGSAMPSDTFCEYCYCIRGNHRCLRPKCQLHVDDCLPIYQQDFSCCPTAYNCSKHEDVPTTSIPTTTLPPTPNGCLVNGTFHQEGQAVIHEDVCQNCFCVNGNVRCSPTSCAIEINGCKPIVQPGKCCPTGYNCSYDNIAEEYFGSTIENNLEESTVLTIETRNFVEDQNNSDASISNRSDNEENTTENNDETEEAVTLNAYYPTSTDSDVAESTTETTENEEEALRTEIGDASFTERSDTGDVFSSEINEDETSTSTFQARFDSSTDFSTEQVVNETNDDEATTENNIYQSSTEILNDESHLEESTYWPESQESILQERNANYTEEENSIASSSTENYELESSTTEDPEESQTSDEKLSDDVELSNVTIVNATDNKVTYRTTSGVDHLHNITAQLVQNVAEHLLADRKPIKDEFVTDRTPVSDIDNFSNWTHVDNETDLLQTSNFNEHSQIDARNESSYLLENEISTHNPPTTNLQGSLHSIVSSLLAKHTVTTEPSYNYSDLFEDLIGEAPGEFHFNPINYLNFSEDVASASSYRNDLLPTTIKYNEIPEAIASTTDSNVEFVTSKSEAIEAIKIEDLKFNEKIVNETQVLYDATSTIEPKNETLNSSSHHEVILKDDVEYENKTEELINFKTAVIDSNSTDEHLKTQNIASANLKNESLDTIDLGKTENITSFEETATIKENELIKVTASESLGEKSPIHDSDKNHTVSISDLFTSFEETTAIKENDLINATASESFDEKSPIHDSEKNHTVANSDLTTPSNGVLFSIHQNNSKEPAPAEHDTPEYFKNDHFELNDTDGHFHAFNYSSTFDFPDSNSSQFSGSDLEDTIEMILNLSKTFAAANKRPTQWVPSENSSVSDLLSGTLPADVELKLAEIIRMAQAGLIPTEEPAPVFAEQHFNNSLNNDGTTPTATDEGDQYYNEYYDDEAKEIPSHLDNLNKSTATESSTTQVPITENQEINFIKTLLHVYQPKNETLNLAPAEILTTTTLLPVTVPVTTANPILNLVTSASLTETTLNSDHSSIITLPQSNNDIFRSGIEQHVITSSTERPDLLLRTDVNQIGEITPIEPESLVAAEPLQEQASNLNNKEDEVPISFSEGEAAEQDDQLGAGSLVAAEPFQEQASNVNNKEEEVPISFSEGEAAEQDDQILLAGSDVHQDEHSFGSESEVAFEEEPYEQQQDDIGGFESLAETANNEEKSYFSSDDNYNSQKPKEEKPSQTEHSGIIEPFDNSDRVSHETIEKEVTLTNLRDGEVTEKLPEVHPELIKDFIESVKLRDEEPGKSTQHQSTFIDAASQQSTSEITTSTTTTTTTPQPATPKLIDHTDESNHFDEEIDAHPSFEHSIPSTSPTFLHTEAVTADKSQTFAGLVTKGSIHFDHVLPLSRRGRPTTDEKTGQALPTPRKSNSSSPQLSSPSPSDSFLDIKDDAPAVIPFLPEDAITDEHIIKEQIFGGGSSSIGVPSEHKITYESPIVIERFDKHQNNASSFELQFNASTAINVHESNPSTSSSKNEFPFSKSEVSPAKDEFLSFKDEFPSLKDEFSFSKDDFSSQGVAVPESHDYEVPAVEIPEITPTIVVATAVEKKTEEPVELAEITEKTSTNAPTSAIPTLNASPLPKFDDYYHHNSPSALGLQQANDYCVEHGEVFQDGERIPTHDYCAQCRCIRGEIQCQHLSCPKKPAGCIEKIVPSSCCPAFVCNETDNSDAPIRSGITIHSGFVPIENPVALSDHQSTKTIITISSTTPDYFFENAGVEIAGEEHHESLSPVPTVGIIKEPTTTKTEDENHGIFGGLLEAVFGLSDHDNRTITDHADDRFSVEMETTPVATTTTESTTSTRPSTMKTTLSSTTRMTSTSKKLSPQTTASPANTKSGESPMLWPMLKVSSCNIYGRVYQLGATIGVLSGPCKECKCTSTGVDCYKVKCF